MSSSKTTKITLEDIEFLKQQKLEELQLQKEIMSETVQLIFAPLEPAASKAESLMRTVNTGMAVFDGVMLGMKTLGRLKQAFSKNTKKKGYN